MFKRPFSQFSGKSYDYIPRFSSPYYYRGVDGLNVDDYRPPRTGGGGGGGRSPYSPAPSPGVLPDGRTGGGSHGTHGSPKVWNCGVMMGERMVEIEREEDNEKYKRDG